MSTLFLRRLLMPNQFPNDADEHLNQHLRILAALNVKRKTMLMSRVLQILWVRLIPMTLRLKWLRSRPKRKGEVLSLRSR